MATNGLISDRSYNKLTGIGAAAGVVLLAGLFISPERAWSNLFVASFILLTTALGGAAFLALTVVAGARWNAAFRRLPEALARA